MRPLGVISSALGLVALAFAGCNSRNQVSSWENQTFIAAGWQTPSSPLVCQEIWNDTKAAPLQSIRETFGIDRFSLQYWNCFLDSADGMSVPNVGYCVKAVLEQTEVSTLPLPSTLPPALPTIPQPIEPVSSDTDSNVVTLWPHHEDAETTPQSTPRPFLTAMKDSTVSNTVFDRLNQNTTLSPENSGSFTNYDYSIWSTVTITRDSSPTAIDNEALAHSALTLGSVLHQRKANEIAPFLPTFKGNRTGFSNSCDAQDGTAEVCHKTRYCAKEDELPTCEDGHCRCVTTPCTDSSDCAGENLNLCRETDQMPHCSEEGTCSCEPRYSGCSDKGKHSYCASLFDCTGWSYDITRLPVCVGDTGYNSWCECKATQCRYSLEPSPTADGRDLFRGDNSTCGELHCAYDEIFHQNPEPGCKWDEDSSLNGTCSCLSLLTIAQ